MLPITKGRRDASPISLDMMYKMDMMPTDRRDVHTELLDRINRMDLILSHPEDAEDAEIFREDVRDAAGEAGNVGMPHRYL